jgi:S-adenosylmethionine hydrolase
MAAPLITLLTDFGLADWYVAAMKAVLLRQCPEARLIDVTHLIKPGDVQAGSIALERAIAAFPAGTVHLAVVDPGVGSQRLPLVARIAGQAVVAPDNGLVTWGWRRHGGGRAYEITWRPAGDVSATFHGRDLFAPMAGLIAAGEATDAMVRPIAGPVLLDIAPADGLTGLVIHIDHFGSALTTVTRQAVEGLSRPVARVHGKNLPVLRTYSEIAAGAVLALVGSSDLLEIAVRDGSAGRVLGLRIGDPVEVREQAI